MEKECEHKLRSVFMCKPGSWIKTDYSMCEKCKKIFFNKTIEIGVEEKK